MTIPLGLSHLCSLEKAERGHAALVAGQEAGRQVSLFSGTLCPSIPGTSSVVWDHRQRVGRSRLFRTDCQKEDFRSSHRGTAERNLTRNLEVAGLIPGLEQCVKDLALP